MESEHRSKSLRTLFSETPPRLHVGSKCFPLRLAHEIHVKPVIMSTTVVPANATPAIAGPLNGDRAPAPGSNVAAGTGKFASAKEASDPTAMGTWVLQIDVTIV
jgi:hypothetical protein